MSGGGGSSGAWPQATPQTMGGGSYPANMGQSSLQGGPNPWQNLTAADYGAIANSAVSAGLWPQPPQAFTSITNPSQQQQLDTLMQSAGLFGSTPWQTGTSLPAGYFTSPSGQSLLSQDFGAYSQAQGTDPQQTASLNPAGSSPSWYNPAASNPYGAIGSGYGGSPSMMWAMLPGSIGASTPQITGGSTDYASFMAGPGSNPAVQSIVSQDPGLMGAWGGQPQWLMPGYNAQSNTLGGNLPQQLGLASSQWGTLGFPSPTSGLTWSPVQAASSGVNDVTWNASDPYGNTWQIMPQGAPGFYWSSGRIQEPSGMNYQQQVAANRAGAQQAANMSAINANLVSGLHYGGSPVMGDTGYSVGSPQTYTDPGFSFATTPGGVHYGVAPGTAGATTIPAQTETVNPSPQYEPQYNAMGSQLGGTTGSWSLGGRVIDPALLYRAQLRAQGMQV